MNIAVVKYNAGNTQSLAFALNKLGVEPLVTDDPHQLRSADKVIFPGQGEASSAMKYLKEKQLDQVIKDLRQPFLGVCLGMQLMCEHSEENNTQGMGIIPAKVKRFNTGLKVPHMGWNTIHSHTDKLLQHVKENSFLYFVHSYYVEVNDFTTSTAHYGLDFTVTLHKDNFYAIQPHPEKSAETGLQILSNFLKLT